MVWPCSCLLWTVGLAVLLCHHTAHARISPAQVFVSSTDQPGRPQASSHTSPSWMIGDVLVASHNEVGFPRVDVLNPTDLSIKDSLDLVPACGGQSKARGISISPRFSPLKLQLAVSCADDKEEGKVVFIAATSTEHAIRKVVPVQNAAASFYNRTGDFFVLGTQGSTQQQSGAAPAARMVNSIHTTPQTPAKATKRKQWRPASCPPGVQARQHLDSRRCSREAGSASRTSSSSTRGCSGSIPSILDPKCS